MMSRKHYIELARVVREADYLPPYARERLTNELVVVLSDDNPRFSARRFREACEPAELAASSLHEVFKGAPGFGWFVGVSRPEPLVVAGPFTSEAAARAEAARREALIAA